MGHPIEVPDSLYEVILVTEQMLRDTRVDRPERNDANQQVRDDHDHRGKHLAKCGALRSGLVGRSKRRDHFVNGHNEFLLTDLSVCVRRCSEATCLLLTWLTHIARRSRSYACALLVYTSDAADEEDSV